MSILIVLFGLFVGLVAFLSLVLFVELMLAWLKTAIFPETALVLTDVSASAKAAILIPAHNEEAVLATTLHSLIPQLREQDELIVVVDNCSDETKAVAQAFPVTILERNDQENKGKGYALDFGIQYCRERSFDVVLMIDADCTVEPVCRDRLVEMALVNNRPVQCLYLMKNLPGCPSFSQKMSEFTWMIKNKLRPLGLRAVQGPCQLMGTGMAFPSAQLYEMEVATGCIVEDMKLGLDFAVNSTPPIFLSSAQVTSYFPIASTVATGQRSRWIHGHLEMICTYVPKLLVSFVKTRRLDTLLLCFDLMVPPVVLLFLVNFLLLLLSFVFLYVGMGHLYLLPLLSLLLIIATVFIAWVCGGKEIISLKDLVLGVFERVRSLTIYLSFFSRDRLKGWNKTSRKE